MKRICFFLTMVFCITSFAENKKFGLGLTLFGPTGISSNYFLSTGDSIDGALAWNTGSGQTMYVHSDYLLKKPELFKIDSIVLDFYYGLGARIINKDSTQGANAGVNLAARVPVGVNYNWQSVPISAFAELAANLNLTPGTSLDLAVALGARYYF